MGASRIGSIIDYIVEENTSQVIFEGLKNLEYRGGYDAAGIGAETLLRRDVDQGERRGV